MVATKLQAVRKNLEYGSAQVIRMLQQRAAVIGFEPMRAASLKTKLSRWENGHETVSEPYRRLFRDIYGRSNEELGFPSETEDPGDAAELRSRLAVARNVDAEMVGVFTRQVDDARRVDRKFGGITVLDQLRTNITQVRDLLTFSTGEQQREQLADVLAAASALAGWEALDRNALKQAWDHHEVAKTAAREARSPTLLAHATAQQAFILIDLDETAAAVAQLAAARELAQQAVPELLQAWLAAAHGEGLAAAGDRDDALRAFDAADAQLPSDPADPGLPFLFLAGAHLDRWRGNAMARLGEPDAIDQLSNTLPRLPSSFVRAKTSMLVDLAFAYASAGDRDAARNYQRQARQLALQIKSDRQLDRLSGLILPTGSRRTT